MLQIFMHIYLLELEACILILTTINTPVLCVRAAKVLARLRLCASSSKYSSLFAYVISSYELAQISNERMLQIRNKHSIELVYAYTIG